MRSSPLHELERDEKHASGATDQLSLIQCLNGLFSIVRSSSASAHWSSHSVANGKAGDNGNTTRGRSGCRG